MCTAALDDHLKYCDAVFRSGKAADCTKNCRTSLDKLYDAFPDFAFCACGTAKCTSNQTNFEKGCFGERERTVNSRLEFFFWGLAGGKRLCSKISAECSHNQQQCDTDIQNYLNACADVIKTGSKSDCTASCKSALKAAWDATPALETCVCASVDANCTLYQNNFNTSECYYGKMKNIKSHFFYGVAPPPPPPPPQHPVEQREYPLLPSRGSLPFSFSDGLHERALGVWCSFFVC